MGTGLFSKAQIKKGDLIHRGFEWGIAKKSASIHPDFRHYCVDVTEQTCLAPAEFDALEIWWFSNHSSKPNMVYKAEERSFYASEDIAPGDEVCHDYKRLGEPTWAYEGYYYEKRSDRQQKNKKLSANNG